MHDVTFEFQLTPTEARDARRAMAVRFELTSWASILALFGSIYAGAVIVWLARRPLGSLGIHGSMLWALAIVASVVTVSTGWSGWWTISKRPYTAAAAREGKTTVRLTETGFEIQAPRLLQRGRWDALGRITQTPGFFLLYVSDLRAIVLPKRAMPPQAIVFLQAWQDRKDEQVGRAFALWGRRFPWG